MWLTEVQKIGVGLTAFGVFFFFIGIIIIDKGLLVIGNILFLSGVTLVIGFSKAVTFFSRKQKWAGTACFFIGFLVVVLTSWTILGILIEIFGFFNLFGDFFPVVINFLRALPGVGHVLNLPGISNVVDKLAGRRLPV